MTMCLLSLEINVAQVNSPGGNMQPDGRVHAPLIAPYRASLHTSNLVPHSSWLCLARLFAIGARANKVARLSSQSVFSIHSHP
jgi:hypothetical protein